MLFAVLCFVLLDVAFSAGDGFPITEKLKFLMLAATMVSSFPQDFGEHRIPLPSTDSRTGIKARQRERKNVNRMFHELVRKNVLHYDTVNNCWKRKLKLSRDQLEKEVSATVLDMIRANIEHMPELVKQVVVIASYVRSTFDLDTLMGCINAIGLQLTRQDLVKALDTAVFHGLLVDTVAGEEYAFAHDSIQETARSIAYGDERNRLSIYIGNALSELGDDDSV
jgi:hypothetical protein